MLINIQTSVLRFVVAAAVLGSTVAEGSCNGWTCDSDCIKCTSLTSGDELVDGVTTTYQIATIDVETCKNDEISWACCTGSQDVNGQPLGCEATSCTGVGSNLATDKEKCESVTSMTVKVPASATSVNINTHDGKTYGNAAASDLCAGNGNQGGKCVDEVPGVTAHCLVNILLASCGGGGGGCPSGAAVDCVASGTICAPKAYDDINCQCDDLDPASTSTECESENPSNCASARYCDGAGVCAPASPLGADVVCKEKDDTLLCDIDDKCDGLNLGCPPLVANTDVVCRPAANACDLAEKCDGVNPDCPCDETRELGYTFKCSTTQFLCGPNYGDITFGNGGQWDFGGCGIGKGKDYVTLNYPDCLSQSLEQDCPANNDGNVRGLSNWALGTCDPTTETWSCTEKVDVSDTTPLPYVPYPDYSPCGDTEPPTCNTVEECCSPGTVCNMYTCADNGIECPAESCTASCLCNGGMATAEVTTDNCNALTRRRLGAHLSW